MMVRVQYVNGHFDMVKGGYLERLLQAHRVLFFQRQEGWVDPGRDPIRRRGADQFYRGPERRQIKAA